MMSIPFQPNDLLHTDRSIAVLLAQTMSGQIDVLNATNIRKIARGSIDDQGFSSVPPITRSWRIRFSSPESPKVRKSLIMGLDGRSIASRLPN
jgi:hypothetical protein